MTYVLGIALSKDIRIRVGALGELDLKKGAYFYVGSARKGVRARIARHLSGKKKFFWHIDYFLSSHKAGIENIWISASLKECKIAKMIQRAGCGFIDKFGSSDCRCESHLFFARTGKNKFKKFFKRNGLKNADKGSF